MTKQIIPFTTEDAWLDARRFDLTSTRIPALFGVHMRDTPFSLWHKLHGNIEDANEDTERTFWGKVLQDSIAKGVLAQQQWFGNPKREYIRDPDLRIGSSFDWEANTVKQIPDPDVLLEIKNVDSLEFKRGWVETDFGLEAPARIELQMQVQLGMAGLREGYIAALVGGNRVELLHREFDEIVWQRILDLAAWFWSLKEAPAPDYARDYEVISRLHGYSSAGKVIEATPEVVDLAAEYRAAAADYSAAEKRKKVAKAKLLELIGDAERVESPEYVISAKEVKPCEIAAYTRDGFRGFRINERSSK